MGSEKITQKILLSYNAEKAGEPILATVIKETGLLLNVLHAKINSQGGEIIISVEASPEQVEGILNRFRSMGVEAKILRQTISLDRERCIDCGACISVCPTRALKFSKEWEVMLDENRCVYCKLCTEACPMRALSLTKLE